MSNYQHWQWQVDDHIGTLTLHRPDHRNALVPEAFKELRQLVNQIKGDRSVWGLVLQSSGEHFSVGVDVKLIQNMVGQIETIYRQNLNEMQDALDDFEQLEKPTIARLRGHCIGGGLLLALACDFRIADDSASFSFPEVRRGIPVVMGTQRVIRTIGVPATKELLLLGESIDAARALALGMVHRVVEPGELDNAVQELAGKFRHLPPRTVGMIKRIIDDQHRRSLPDNLVVEVDAHADLLNSPDFKEAVDSFFEKRPPSYSGQ